MYDYKYKNRWDATKKAWTHGAWAARHYRLSEHYKRWSPIQIYLYQVGVCAGIFAGILIGITIGLLLGIKF